MFDKDKPVYALRHLDNGRFICVLKDGVDYLMSYSALEDALELRAELSQEEFCEVCSLDVRESGVRHLWLDGQYVDINCGIGADINEKAPQPPAC
jgi:hypothetical protein